jgi:hypothetical protein
MAAPTQPAPPPETSSATGSTASRSWSLDDLIVLLFALFGLAGGVLFPRYLHTPPITTSFLLATGLAALTYRFLGGIQSASFAVGGLKLGGSLAALVGIALLINHELVPELQRPAPTPSAPLRQAYHVTGTAIDDKGQPVNGLAISNFSVSPPGTNPGFNGNFSLTFANGLDFNEKPTFPSLTIKDGVLVSDNIQLQPQPSNGLEIRLGTIQLHTSAAGVVHPGAAPPPAAVQTAAITPPPEQQQ